MLRMDTTQIINFLKDNPSSIAGEIGTTTVEMSRLEAQGLVMRVGDRKTGKPGRPPVEWAVTGAEVEQDERASDHIKKARLKVENHREYERLSSTIVHAANNHGHFSVERQEAIEARKQAFPTPPPVPTKGDFVLIGAAVIEDDS